MLRNLTILIGLGGFLACIYFGFTGYYNLKDKTNEQKLKQALNNPKLIKPSQK